MSKIDFDLVNALNTMDDLLLDSRFTNAFQAPINRELLAHKLSQIQELLDQEEGSNSSSSGTHQNYTDFLLPLPDNLIPTESGMVHPDVINSSRSSRGLNTKMDSNHRKALEQKHANKLKQKLGMKNKSKPRLGMMPTPFGTTKREED